MGFEHIRIERSGDFATVTMNRPQRRNALSLEHMRELISAFGELGHSDVLGIVLAGNGPVFSSGHDLAEVAGGDLPQVRSLLMTCTELMTLIQQVPQPVVARVHGLATAAGCQLVATADLAVASEDAGFAAPGGKGGWFCHTPMVAVPGTWAASGPPSWPCRGTSSTRAPRWTGAWSTGWSPRRSSTPRCRTCWTG